MALLEIVTRTCKRPLMLAANRAALYRQTDTDWKQTLLIDNVGLGIAASYERLSVYEPSGEWVWVLDDDDICICDGLVSAVRATDAFDYDALMVKMDHGGVVLPDKFVWGKAPQRGHIGVSAYIVRREIWMEYRHAFALPNAEHVCSASKGGGCYSSDFDFIDAVFSSASNVYWLDVVASKMQRGISGGKPE